MTYIQAPVEPKLPLEMSENTLKPFRTQIKQLALDCQILIFLPYPANEIVWLLSKFQIFLTTEPSSCYCILATTIWGQKATEI